REGDEYHFPVLSLGAGVRRQRDPHLSGLFLRREHAVRVAKRAGGYATAGLANCLFNSLAQRPFGTICRTVDDAQFFDAIAKALADPLPSHAAAFFHRASVQVEFERIVGQVEVLSGHNGPRSTGRINFPARVAFNGYFRPARKVRISRSTSGSFDRKM